MRIATPYDQRRSAQQRTLRSSVKMDTLRRQGDSTDQTRSEASRVSGRGIKKAQAPLPPSPPTRQVRKPLGEISLAQADKQARRLRRKKDATEEATTTVPTSGTRNSEPPATLIVLQTDDSVGAQEAGPSTTPDTEAALERDSRSRSPLQSVKENDCAVAHVVSAKGSPTQSSAKSAVAHSPRSNASPLAVAHSGPTDENDDSPGRERRLRRRLESNSHEAVLASPSKRRRPQQEAGSDTERGASDDEGDAGDGSWAVLQKGPIGLVRSTPRRIPATR